MPPYPAHDYPLSIARQKIPPPSFLKGSHPQRSPLGHGEPVERAPPSKYFLHVFCHASVDARLTSVVHTGRDGGEHAVPTLSGLDV
jgi:hypothetical protein